MSITVEKGIPIPQARSAGRAPKYPFEQMVPGSSFAVPLDPNVSERRNMQRLASCSAAWAKRREINWTFAVRVRHQDEAGKAIEPEVRIWRNT